MIHDVENFMNNYRTTETSFASINLNHQDVNLADQYNQFL